MGIQRRPVNEGGDTLFLGARLLNGETGNNSFPGGGSVFYPLEIHGRRLI
jgi:hypothetical protein